MPHLPVRSEVWFDAEPTAFVRSLRERVGAGLDPKHVSSIESLRTDGFAVLPFSFPAELIDDAASITLGLKERWRRAQDLWRKERAIRALACYPPLLSFLSVAYDRRAFPFQTLNFPTGSEQAPHADTLHFSSEPFGFMCGVWIALEDVGAEQGPLQYFPGSQHLAPIDGGDLSAQGGASAYPALMASNLRKAGLKSKTLHLRKGQIALWVANLVHGGSPVLDPESTRLSQVVHYYFSNCVYTTPLKSDSSTGRMDIRQPFDIDRQCFAVNMKNGQRIQPSFRALAGAWRDRLTSKVRCFA